jgi:hypothetical protein
LETRIDLDQQTTLLMILARVASAPRFWEECNGQFSRVF